MRRLLYILTAFSLLLTLALTCALVTQKVQAQSSGSPVSEQEIIKANMKACVVNPDTEEREACSRDVLEKYFPECADLEDNEKLACVMSRYSFK